jgi:rhamnose utilization protein RhaD (predicted bifunctional aldolase and dehydrogenase)/NAD(P)-dependent dehydrogenase (short-subunit alcohol dehydrogenase family)
VPRNLWDNVDASEFRDDLAQRIYTSRLLGRDESLVLHGGGNTSVKTMGEDEFGRAVEILYVKASGHDLIDIDAGGFAPLRCVPTKQLAELAELPDSRMVNELSSYSLDASAPPASVEAILHAILPFRFVDHTHADAIVTLTNSVDGLVRIREVFGESALIVPYVMPGFKLSRAVREMITGFSLDGRIGMILMNHGIFSWGDAAKESYDRMISLVQMAEDYLKEQPLRESSFEAPRQHAELCDIAELRREISRRAGGPVLLRTFDDDRSRRFVSRSDIESVSQQGPATPDHVIRTKRVPMIGSDVDTYAAEYARYFDENSTAGLEMLDPAPRVILDRRIGFAVSGKSSKDLRIVEDIYRHTMDIIENAEDRLGGYRALPENDLFDMEYWDLEQAKLKRAGKPRMFAGEVAMVTGSASGIGKACAKALLARGAAVVGVDISPHQPLDEANSTFEADITDHDQIRRVLDAAVRMHGGLDMLVLSAGVFPPTEFVASTSIESWRRTMSLNLDSAFQLLSTAYPFLKRSPRGARVVVIGSKNVAAPGPGAAAYSVSKAALTQLMRVLALEWSGDSIRINTVHPNAVFDTGVWTDEKIAARAKSYGMTPEQYRRNNLLGVEITSADVGELVAEMCGPLFSKVHGAQIAIDGGNERTG